MVLLLLHNEAETDIPGLLLKLPQIDRLLSGAVEGTLPAEHVPYAKDYVLHGCFRLGSVHRIRCLQKKRQGSF